MNNKKLHIKMNILILLITILGCFKKVNLSLKEKDNTFDNAIIIEKDEDINLINLLKEGNLLQTEAIKVKTKGKVYLNGNLEIKNLKIEAEEFINNGHLIADKLVIKASKFFNSRNLNIKNLTLECSNIFNISKHGFDASIKSENIRIVTNHLENGLLGKIIANKIKISSNKLEEIKIINNSEINIKELEIESLFYILNNKKIECEKGKLDIKSIENKGLIKANEFYVLVKEGFTNLADNENKRRKFLIKNADKLKNDSNSVDKLENNYRAPLGLHIDKLEINCKKFINIKESGIFVRELEITSNIIENEGIISFDDILKLQGEEVKVAKVSSSTGFLNIIGNNLVINNGIYAEEGINIKAAKLDINENVYTLGKLYIECDDLFINHSLEVKNIDIKAKNVNINKNLHKLGKLIINCDKLDLNKTIEGNNIEITAGEAVFRNLEESNENNKIINKILAIAHDNFTLKIKDKAHIKQNIFFIAKNNINLSNSDSLVSPKFIIEGHILSGSLIKLDNIIVDVKERGEIISPIIEGILKEGSIISGLLTTTYELPENKKIKEVLGNKIEGSLLHLKSDESLSIYGLLSTEGEQIIDIEKNNLNINGRIQANKLSIHVRKGDLTIDKDAGIEVKENFTSHSLNLFHKGNILNEGVTSLQTFRIVKTNNRQGILDLLGGIKSKAFYSSGYFGFISGDLAIQEESSIYYNRKGKLFGNITSAKNLRLLGNMNLFYPSRLISENLTMESDQNLSIPKNVRIDAKRLSLTAPSISIGNNLKLDTINLSAEKEISIEKGSKVEISNELKNNLPISKEDRVEVIERNLKDSSLLIAKDKEIIKKFMLIDPNLFEVRGNFLKAPFVSIKGELFSGSEIFTQSSCFEILRNGIFELPGWTNVEDKNYVETQNFNNLGKMLIDGTLVITEENLLLKQGKQLILGPMGRIITNKGQKLSISKNFPINTLGTYINRLIYNKSPEGVIKYKSNSLLLTDNDFPEVKANFEKILLKTKRLELTKWPLFLLDSNVEVNAEEISINSSNTFPKNLTFKGLNNTLFNLGFPLSLNGYLSLSNSLVNLFEINSDIFANGGISFDKNIKISKGNKISTISETSVEAGDITFEEIENHGTVETKILKAKSIKNHGEIIAKGSAENETPFSSFIDYLENYKNGRIQIFGGLKGYLNDYSLSLFNKYGNINIRGDLICGLSLNNIGIIEKNISNEEEIKGYILVSDNLFIGEPNKTLGTFINRHSGKIEVGKNLEICGTLENLAETREYKNLPLRFYMRRSKETEHYKSPSKHSKGMAKDRTFEFSQLHEFEISAHKKILEIMGINKIDYYGSYYWPSFKYPTWFFNNGGYGKAKWTLPYKSEVKVNNKYFKDGWYRKSSGDFFLFPGCYESTFDFEVDYHEVLQAPTLNIRGTLIVKDKEGEIKEHSKGKEEHEAYNGKKWTDLYLTNQGILTAEEMNLKGNVENYYNPILNKRKNLSDMSLFIEKDYNFRRTINAHVHIGNMSFSVRGLSKDMLFEVLSYEDQIGLQMLVPSLVTCLGDQDIAQPIFRHPVSTEILLFESALKKLGTFYIRKEAFDFTHDYLLALSAPLLWIENVKNNSSLLQIPTNVKNLIANNNYIKAINYYFNQYKTNRIKVLKENTNNNEGIIDEDIEGKEALQQIVGYRKSLSDEEVRKFVTPLSLEQLQEMADSSNFSGIAYETKICKDGIARLYPKVIVSKADEENHKPKNGMHSKTNVILEKGSFENTGNFSGNGSLIIKDGKEIINEAVNPSDNASGNIQFGDISTEADKITNKGGIIESTDGKTILKSEKEMNHIATSYLDKDGKRIYKTGKVDSTEGTELSSNGHVHLEGAELGSKNGDTKLDAKSLTTEASKNEDLCKAQGDYYNSIEVTQGSSVGNTISSANGNVDIKVKEDANLKATEFQASKDVNLEGNHIKLELEREKHSYSSSQRGFLNKTDISGDEEKGINNVFKANNINMTAEIVDGQTPDMEFSETGKAKINATKKIDLITEKVKQHDEMVHNGCSSNVTDLINNTKELLNNMNKTSKEEKDPLDEGRGSKSATYNASETINKVVNGASEVLDADTELRNGNFIEHVKSKMEVSGTFTHTNSSTTKNSDHVSKIRGGTLELNAPETKMDAAADVNLEKLKANKESDLKLRAQQEKIERKSNTHSATFSMSFSGIGVAGSTSHDHVIARKENTQNINIKCLDGAKVDASGNNLNVDETVNGGEASTRDARDDLEVVNSYKANASTNVNWSGVPTSVSVGASIEKGSKRNHNKVNVTGKAKKIEEANYNHIYGLGGSTCGTLEVSFKGYGFKTDLAAYKRLANSIKNNIAVRKAAKEAERKLVEGVKKLNEIYEESNGTNDANDENVNKEKENKEKEKVERIMKENFNKENLSNIQAIEINNINDDIPDNITGKERENLIIERLNEINEKKIEFINTTKDFVEKEDSKGFKDYIIKFYKDNEKVVKITGLTLGIIIVGVDLYFTGGQYTKEVALTVLPPIIWNQVEKTRIVENIGEKAGETVENLIANLNIPEEQKKVIANEFKEITKDSIRVLGMYFVDKGVRKGVNKLENFTDKFKLKSQLQLADVNLDKTARNNSNTKLKKFDLQIFAKDSKKAPNVSNKNFKQGTRNNFNQSSQNNLSKPNSDNISKPAGRKHLESRADIYKSQFGARNGKPKDATTMKAAAMERRGKQIQRAKETGKVYDHITKEKNAKEALKNNIVNIKNKLDNPNTSDEERTKLINYLSKDSKYLDKVNKGKKAKK